MNALRWPRSLFARLALILFVGLAAGNAASFWLTMTERNQATMNVMVGYIEREVASSVALLDRLPAAERPAWLPRLARRSYHFMLEPGVSGVAPDATLSARVAASIKDGIGTDYELTANAVPGDRERLQVHLRLSDGAPLTIDITPMPGIPLSRWLPLLLALQLAVLVACCWFAVRLATRPLHQLAKAADTLGPDLKAERLAEDGPSEVARAARAFNAMQERIGAHLDERTQILAAISHDLQTPITRMRMRADMMDDEIQREKMNRDLVEMEMLVRDGVAYARTLHGTSEAACRVDLDSLLGSLVGDYLDGGHPVKLEGKAGAPIVTRPHALRRVLGNLIDNALKYAGSADLHVDSTDERVTIRVRDHGGGIPDDELDNVMQPFYRLEASRNRDTGGTGLGLAIARQLAQAIGATLTLRNHPDGGLEATLTLMPPS